MFLKITMLRLPVCLNVAAYIRANALKAEIMLRLRQQRTENPSYYLPVQRLDAPYRFILIMHIFLFSLLDSLTQGD